MLPLVENGKRGEREPVTCSVVRLVLAVSCVEMATTRLHISCRTISKPGYDTNGHRDGLFGFFRNVWDYGFG